MDGTDEWALVNDNNDSCAARNALVNRKNAYCNTIRDYNKLSEIAAKIINAMGIKNEEADEVLPYDIKSLDVEGSNDTIVISWKETYDRGYECQSTIGLVNEVPAEWFALDESNLRSVVHNYVEKQKVLISGLERDLAKAEAEAKDADTRIKELKNKILKARDNYGLWS